MQFKRLLFQVRSDLLNLGGLPLPVGKQSIALWTPEFPLFLGTAVFAYEGIAMILPLEESMKVV